MKFLLFVFGLLLQLPCFAQTSKEPVEVTPEVQKIFFAEVETLVPSFQKALTAKHLNKVQEEFALDTFRVERFMAKWVKLDYSDAGMSGGTYAGAKLYDSLLNKYYKRLLAVLKPADKSSLVQAQRAWISFRDAEFKLVETISKDEYSGGGTLQRLTESGEYLTMVRDRLVTLFNHYTRATQNE